MKRSTQQFRRTTALMAVLAAAAVLAVVGVFGPSGDAPKAQAATGDSLASFDAAVTAGIPACSVGTGIAFDGTNLFLSCWGSNVLQRVNAATHASGGAALTIAGMTDIKALAFDSSRGKIWACQGNATVFLIDPVASTSVTQFPVAGCTDGLAYDGADDTIWASGDQSDTISHYTNTGALIASFSGMVAKLGGRGNSGIAVGGTNLYLGNDGGSQIYQCDKGLVACTLMSTSATRRVEDLECDNVTFPGKNAIWSQDAYDRILTAWEIPAGTCGLGGSAGQPVATPTQGRLKTHTPTATTTAAATSTPVPTTNTPSPSATGVPVIPASPTGGRAGAIVGPNTGSGPGSGSSRSLFLFGAMMIAVSGMAATAIGRKVRR